MERTGHQAAVNQALATAGAGSRTLEPDQRQEEGRHTQEEEGALPRTPQGVGQHQQTAEHLAEPELHRLGTPTHSMLNEQQGLT